MPVAPLSVEFLTREGCPLCDEAEEWLAVTAARLGLAVERIDVDAHADLADRYGGVVPVLRTPEGLVVAEGRWPRYRTFVQLMSYRLTRSRREFGPPDEG